MCLTFCVSQGCSSQRARGQAPDYWHPDPYQQTFGYDAFSHSTSRSGLLYNRMLSDSGTYTNNRRSGWTYDADGNNTQDTSYNQTFDAAGRYTQAVARRTVGDGSTQWPNQPELEITQSYDGNGQSLKRNQTTRMNDYDQETGQYNGVVEDNQTIYYLRSSVLGGMIIDELRNWQNNVVKTEGYVYAGGQRIAKQSGAIYEHHNELTGSWVTTNASNRYVVRQERDPANGTLPLDAPPAPYNYTTANFGGSLFIDGGDPANYSGGHEIDGMPVSDSEFARQAGNGSLGATGTYEDGTKVQYDTVSLAVTGSTFSIYLDGAHLQGASRALPPVVETNPETGEKIERERLAIDTNYEKGRWVSFSLQQHTGGGGGTGHGGGRTTDTVTKDPCPPDKRRFFNWLVDPLTKMAQDLNTTKELLLTQAVKEAGWTKHDLDHNQPLKNPFGVNKIKNGKAVGNVAYPTLDAAIQYWEQRYGDQVRGAQTPQAFGQGMQHLPGGGQYNTVNPNYEKEYTDRYSDVLRYMKLCGIR